MGVEATGWRTSSYSSSGGGNCVEVGVVDGGGVAVRHSRNPAGAMIVVADAEWAAFVTAVRAGSFDC